MLPQFSAKHNPAPSNLRRPLHVSAFKIGHELHRIMVTAHKGLAVYNRWWTLTGVFWSYEGFLAKLLGNGHGRLAADDLPNLCRAMRDCGLDPAAVISGLSVACGLCAAQPDGDLTDELCMLARQTGDLAAKIEQGSLPELGRDDLRYIQRIAARLVAIANNLQAETQQEMQQP